jgi:hypothetical protein
LRVQFFGEFRDAPSHPSATFTFFTEAVILVSKPGFFDTGNLTGTVFPFTGFSPHSDKVFSSGENIAVTADYKAPGEEKNPHNTHNAKHRFDPRGKFSSDSPTRSHTPC